MHTTTLSTLRPRSCSLQCIDTRSGPYAGCLLWRLWRAWWRLRYLPPHCLPLFFPADHQAFLTSTLPAPPSTHDHPSPLPTHHHPSSQSTTTLIILSTITVMPTTLPNSIAKEPIGLPITGVIGLVLGLSFLSVAVLYVGIAMCQKRRRRGGVVEVGGVWEVGGGGVGGQSRVELVKELG